MSKPYFRFKQFSVQQDRCAMKVTTDACLFGAWCAEEIRQQEVKAKEVLDIGTGTGILSLMVAQKNEEVKIDTVEIDEESQKQASENITATAWSLIINTYHTDIDKFTFNKSYDAIISNPPFYENELTSADIQKNLALHSTALTLDKLLAIIKRHLTPNGLFFLLLPYKRVLEIEKLVAKHDLHIHTRLLVKQSVNHDYFRVIVKGGHMAAPKTTVNELSICDNQQQYTPEFTALLKDYYLYL